jgi:protein TonB
MLWALAGAVVLHIAALGIPLPETPKPEIPVRKSPPLELLRFDLTPPPLQEPPVVTSTEIVRLTPVPFVTPERITDPVDESAPVLDPGPVIDSSPALGVENPVPPPSSAPSVYPDDTRDLVVPVRLPGAAEVEYPRLARQIRQQGRVLLKAVITETGEVERIEVLEAPELELGFVEAAIEAVSRWRYRPGTLHDRPVAVALTVVVDFTLN